MTSHATLLLYLADKPQMTNIFFAYTASTKFREQ